MNVEKKNQNNGKNNENGENDNGKNAKNDNGKKNISVISIDIGEKNFCIIKSRINKEWIDDLKCYNIDYRNRYNSQGTSTEEFSLFSTILGTRSDYIFLDKVNFVREGDSRIGKRLDITSDFLFRITLYLKNLHKEGLFNDVSYFLIEKQIGRKAFNNWVIMHHVRSCLIDLLQGDRLNRIILFPSKYKTIVLGAPKFVEYKKRRKKEKEQVEAEVKGKRYGKIGGKKDTLDINESGINMRKMTYYDRKKWASSTVEDILMRKGDFATLEKIKSGKCDDYSDCILMTNAFLIRRFFPK